ncbi:substrate-binding domain-containing protein [Streptosporangium lutulentum]
MGLFTSRAADLDVELSVHDPRKFGALLHSRTVDVAIGPRAGNPDESLACRPFLNYQVIVVSGPDHPLAQLDADTHRLREETWLLGPSAAADIGVIPAILRRLKVSEGHQRIFQSHSAALEEVKRNHGVAPTVSFAVAQDLANGRLVRVAGRTLRFDGVWATSTLAERGASSAAAELVRFVTTPRATQAMLRGPGVSVGRFRPSVHVTLWS